MTAPSPLSDGMRRSVVTVLVLVTVAAIAIVLTVQGWKSRAPAFDLLPYIYGARELLDSGALPRHGDTGSYGSYKPPGTAWLMVPSLALLGDPRLADYVGAGLLHCATLLGIFLLARRHFGNGCAFLSVAVYGLSEHALFLAGSLWPNGRPDFFVWIVYLVDRWITDRDARFLAAAVTVWGLGMHVDMAITPALFILPVVWLAYRPPVSVRPLVLAGAVLLVVWSPYLGLQVPRGFADMRSQLLQQNILPGDYRRTWCEPALQLTELADGPASVLAREVSSPGEGERAARPLPAPVRRVLGLIAMAGSNFHTLSPVPGVGLVLLAMTLLGLVAFGAIAQPADRSGGSGRPSLPRTAAGLAVLAGAVAIAVMLRAVSPDAAGLPVVVRVLRRLTSLVAAGGLAFATIPWAIGLVSRLADRLGVDIQSVERAHRRGVLVLCLVVPWLVLLLVAEPGKPERFWWLWPLQVMLLAAVVTNLLPRLGVRPLGVRIVAAALVIAIAVNPFAMWRLGSWMEMGWAGPDAEEVQAVDAVAHRLLAEGRQDAAIGYAIFIYPFMAEYNITNPQYKVGAEFDVFFRLRHGITNTNGCAEGVAADDEYRIVQLRRKTPDWAPRHAFRVDHAGFAPLADVASYRILGRVSEGAVGGRDPR